MMVGLLHDTPAGQGIQVPELLEKPTSTDALEAPHLPQTGYIATVYTSGSTGTMRPSPMTAEQLLGEASTLCDCFGMAANMAAIGRTCTW